MSDGYIIQEAGERLRFVGDFDGLYRSDPDPWGQSGSRKAMASYYSASRQRLARVLSGHIGNYMCGLEVGCGYGHVMEAVWRRCGGYWSGLDISTVAIERAKGIYPGLKFYVGDIAGEMPFPPSYVGKYHVVILSQMLWYVLERLDRAVCNASRLVRPGGLLVVSQAFLKGEQRYGAEIANGFHGALALFMARYPDLALVEAHYDDSGAHAHHDGLMLFRKAGANAQ
jgi:SAM-dependent methyltransferase